MTNPEVAARLVALCSEFQNFAAMDELYADDIVSLEGQPNSGGKTATSGKQAVIDKSKAWAAAHEIHGASIEGPFLSSDGFAVIFDFEVTPKATGIRTKLREIAVYTVNQGLIVREEFFYGANGDALSR